MKEGNITHEQVNAAVAAAPKTLLFGSQNRRRQGLQVGDQPLRRLHLAHDQVRFFYSALRQLPEFFFDALLDSRITVTVVMDCDLLCFKDMRNHQAVHIGLARRTIYLPEGILAAVHRNGYDYWSLTQIILAEGWKLLDYALLVALVEAGLRRHYTHLTSMGHSAFRHVVKVNNHHRSAYESPLLREKQQRSGMQFPINELEEFIELYEKPFLKLLRPSLKGKPITADELAHQLYDEYQEELWAQRKVVELAEQFQYPSYFLLDRDVVHPLACQRAENAGQDPAPRNIDEARHDLADELRFGRHRDGAVERFVQAAMRFGAAGAEGLLREICAALFITGRIDEDLEERVTVLLAARSTRGLIGVQGTLRHGLALARCSQVLRFYVAVKTGERRLHLEDFDWIRALLISLVAAKSGPGDFTQNMVIDAIEKVEELFAQFRVLLAREAGRLLGRTVAGEEVESPALGADIDRLLGVAAAALSRLIDLPEDYQKRVLDHFGSEPRAEAAAAPTVPIEGPMEGPVEDIVDQVSRILALLPSRLHAASSGSATAPRRLLRDFEYLRTRFPNDPDQLPLLAMVLVRLDHAENYEQLLEEIRALGSQALGERVAVRERAQSGRLVDRVGYTPGLLKVIEEDGWEGSAAARNAAELVRELAGEEVLVPLREEARRLGRA
ncbi:MAG: hypothetical protein IT369_19415 [Candidatus Latescibacteria bacterium]|nr:hypothetical protein [Candidatus Latescibacterota bacterium]